VAINEEIPHVELPVTFAGNRDIGVVSLVMFRVHAAKDKLTARRCIRISVEPEGEHIVCKQFLLLHALPDIAHRRKSEIQVAHWHAKLYISDVGSWKAYQIGGALPTDISGYPRPRIPSNFPMINETLVSRVVSMNF
jgi:hypothetical protein